MINVGSDFSGVGAFNQALNRLNIKYNELFACDKDKFARQTFILNYGRPCNFPTDVYKRKIPREPLDLYMTSPPCQTFSKWNHEQKQDERGILFFNSHEFIAKNKPRYFIFENVKGLLSNDDDKTFKEWLNYLGGKSINGLPVLFPYEKAVPYHIYYKVLNAKNYNVPQNRERVFIVGIRDDKDNNFTWPKELHLQKKLSDILENDLGNKYKLSKTAIESIQVFQDRKINFCVRSGNLKGYDVVKNGDSIIISQPRSKTLRGRVGKQIAQTLDTGNNQAVFINNIVRRLSPRECFRLMDFDDNFKWHCSDSQAYKQAGNSIVVKCLELIIQKLNLYAPL